jgi:hypothetical protein
VGEPDGRLNPHSPSYSAILLVFVYHCFDRIGHSWLTQRPVAARKVGHFFRQVVGVAAVDKEMLSRRTADYQN